MSENELTPINTLYVTRDREFTIYHTVKHCAYDTMVYTTGSNEGDTLKELVAYEAWQNLVQLSLDGRSWENIINCMDALYTSVDYMRDHFEGRAEKQMKALGWNLVKVS